MTRKACLRLTCSGPLGHTRQRAPAVAMTTCVLVSILAGLTNCADMSRLRQPLNDISTRGRRADLSSSFVHRASLSWISKGAASAGSVEENTFGRRRGSHGLSGLTVVEDDECEIPGFAEGDLSRFDPNEASLSWCPSQFGRPGTTPTSQPGFIALDVELNRCMFTLGRITADTADTHRDYIRENCRTLWEMLPSDVCQCPSDYLDLGRD